MNAGQRADLAVRLERKMIGEDPASTSAVGASRYRMALEQAGDWIAAIEDLGYSILPEPCGRTAAFGQLTCGRPAGHSEYGVYSEWEESDCDDVAGPRPSDSGHEPQPSIPDLMDNLERSLAAAKARLEGPGR